MQICIRIFIAASVLFATFVTFGEDLSSRRSKEIQADSVKYRKSHYQHGIATITLEELESDGNDGIKIRETVSRQVWFDGACLRNDRLNSADIGFKGAVCGNNYIIQWSNDVRVVTAPIKEYGTTNDAIDSLHLWHPRWVGMSYNANALLAEDNTALIFPVTDEAGLVSKTVNEEMAGEGANVLVIQYEYAGTTQGDGVIGEVAEEIPFVLIRTFRVEPDKGDSLLSAQEVTRFPAQATEIVSEVNTSYALEEKTATWYPYESLSTLRQDGRLVSGRRIKIADMSFAKPDPGVFEISGFHFDKDQQISDRTDGVRQKEFFWDGTKAVPIPSEVVTDRIGDPPNQSWTRWILWLNLTVFAVIAIFAICRIFTGRS